MIEAIVFIFGLLIGSFLNVCIYRLPRDGSVVRPRSHCTNCGHMIAGYDNIPLLSYLLLKGRCRHCFATIYWRYPLVELLAGLLFTAAYVNWGWSLYTVKMAICVAMLLGMVFTDIETRLLPDEFTIGGTVVGMILAWFIPIRDGIASILVDSENAASVMEAALGATIAAGSLWLVGEIFKLIRHKEGLGFGDVKMAAMMGAFLGVSPTLMALMLSCVTGSVVGLAFIVISKKKGDYELPLGSFLGAAAIVVALWGQPILRWYVNL
jgi:leader peptidase (prepilin peptidase)/N-methyltransferase